MKEKFERIRLFLRKVLTESTVFRIFAGEGIRGSFLFRAMCLPYAAFTRICAKYGGKIQGSVLAGEAALETCVLAFLAIVPFNLRLTPFAGVALVLVYSLRAASCEGFAKPACTLDALIVMFAVIFAAVSGGVSLYGIFALFLYSVLTKSIDGETWQKAVCAFLLGSALAAALGRIGTGKFYTEFYVLAIPFGFAAARELEKPYKAVTYGFCTLLALTFATSLSKGTITPAGIALCLFLCIRDLRFVLPVLAAAGAVFGIFADELRAVGNYSFSFISGLFTLVMSAVFYLNLMSYSSKRRFLRTATAALGSGSALFLSGGGEGGMEFMFFTILALVSSHIETKKLGQGIDLSA